MSNPIQIENALPGTVEWQLTNPVSLTDRNELLQTPILEGYASATSVNAGGVIDFYVNTTSSRFSLQIFRMGYYGGLGGRAMPDASWHDLQGMAQPMPNNQPVSCDWMPVAPLNGGMSSLHVPADWVSGVYVAKLTEGATQKQGYIIFVVRNDNRTADYLFQCSVMTYQAYNGWGGQSYYGYNCVPPGDNFTYTVVSFDRPYMTGSDPTGAAGNGAGQFFTWDKGLGFDLHPQPYWYNGYVPPSAWEYSAVRWLENEGYDVAYCTDIDTAMGHDWFFKYPAFLSVGHDEYWSQAKQTNVAKARDGKTGLAFLSGNVDFRLVEFNSDTGPLRLMTYLETYPIPPYGDEPPYPQAPLLGEVYIEKSEYNGVNMYVSAECPAWVLEGTALHSGDQVGTNLAGYEIDGRCNLDQNDPDLPGAPPGSPPGVILLFNSQDLWRSDYTWHRWVCSNIYQVEPLAMGKSPRSWVFTAGTMDWCWALDDFTLPGVAPANPTRAVRLSPDIQQITRNVLHKILAK